MSSYSHQIPEPVQVTISCWPSCVRGQSPGLLVPCLRANQQVKYMHSVILWETKTVSCQQQCNTPYLLQSTIGCIEQNNSLKTACATACHENRCRGYRQKWYFPSHHGYVYVIFCSYLPATGLFLELHQGLCLLECLKLQAERQPGMNCQVSYQTHGLWTSQAHA